MLILFYSQKKKQYFENEMGRKETIQMPQIMYMHLGYGIMTSLQKYRDIHHRVVAPGL